MAISASNFRSNSLSGTVSVVNGFANISLATIPYALEGNKSFVIKLRNGSPTGEVLAVSPTITLQDTSSVVSLTSNVSSVAEGSAVTFTLTTANAINGSNVYYTSNIGSPDFTGANTGLLTIINNTATFTLIANADVLTEGAESFKVDIRTSNTSGNIVYSSNALTIQDTSNAEISASGGNDTFTFAGYKYHVFLSSNNFVISNPSSNITVDYMLIAGGGGGAVGAPNPLPGSGAGAGGLLMGNISISGTTSIVVGAGGAPASSLGTLGNQGANTNIFDRIAFGGGAGDDYVSPVQNGQPGGSGGGGGGDSPGGAPGGLAIGSPGLDIAGTQGYPGGSVFGSNPMGRCTAGGGGAGGAGLSFYGYDNGPRTGGIGIVPTFLGIPSSYGTPGPAPGRYFAGGGGGSTMQNVSATGDGGSGGGGRGAMSGPQALQAFSGNVNTGGGGGGGGGSPSYLGGSGGSGIAIIRYPVTVASTSSIEYLAVAGGGGGGYYGGGGGAGGVLYNASLSISGNVQYTITIGSGGSGGSGDSAANKVAATNGANTVISGTGISTITAIGGGHGQMGTPSGASASPATDGGSGGGTWAGSGQTAGNGTAGPPIQGYAGGNGEGSGGDWAGGGGGAGQIGFGGGNATIHGQGGNGISTYSSLLSSANAGVNVSGIYYIAGGGGGGGYGTANAIVTGGLGGGGYGKTNLSGTAIGFPGTVNTGSGGGGAGYGTTAPNSSFAGNGGSGIVIIRYPGTCKPATITGANVTYTSDGANLIYKFTGSGTITF